WLARDHKGRDRPRSVDIAARPCAAGTDEGTKPDRERGYRAAHSQQAVLPPLKGDHQVPGQFRSAPRAQGNVDDYLPTGVAVGRHHRSLSPVVEDKDGDGGVARGDRGAGMQGATGLRRVGQRHDDIMTRAERPGRTSAHDRSTAASTSTPLDKYPLGT